MSHNTNLQELLSTYSYNLEEIMNFLEYDINDYMYINMLYGVRPLSAVFMNPITKCTIDIVRLLLIYGADVNLRDRFVEYTPLNHALVRSTDEGIIAALLEKVANINDHHYDNNGRSLLHYVYKNYGKYKLGYPNSKPGQKTKVLNILLEAGLDLNKISDKGRSPLCLALSKGADVLDIELLLSKGGSLNACQKHPSPLHCITDGMLYRR